MFIEGTYKVLYLDLKDGEGFLPVGCLTSNSFNESSDMIDSTTRDNLGWKTSRPTNQGYNLSFDGLVLEDNVSFTNNTYFSLTLAKRDRTLIDWKVNEDDYGSGYITNLSNENNIDENVSFSSEIIGYGMPISQLNFIYNAYSDRDFAGGGAIENKKCLLNYIDDIL